MAGDGDSREKEVRSRTRAKLSHLERVLFPAAGITKLDVVGYYLRMAPFILPYLRDRPITMHRFPRGVEGKGFYEKDAPAGTPAFVETFTHWAEAPGRDVDFVLCNNTDTLAWLANIASLEIHATLSRTATYETPDLVFIDIDPEPPFPFDGVVDVALAVRDRLADSGLRSFVKTSGKKGLHVVAPIRPDHSFDSTRVFAQDVGKEIARGIPRVVSEFTRSREKGTVFVDYLQNAPGKTMVAPYSLRATPGATVSAPLRWEELRHGLHPAEFTCRSVLARDGDPWRDLFSAPRALP